MKLKRYKIFLAINIGVVIGLMALLTYAMPHFIYVWVGYVITSIIELLANEITDIEKRNKES